MIDTCCVNAAAVVNHLQTQSRAQHFLAGKLLLQP
jgi:hypothetical protein